VAAIALEQEVYTSGMRGFTTVARSPGLTPEELREIEDRSVYQLPMDLLYDDNLPKPVKYVFYRLSSKRLTVGRCISFGRDCAGRAGNFLFHNVVADEPSLESFSRNPVKLLRQLVSEGHFLERLPESSELGPLLLQIPSDTQQTGMRMLQDPELAAVVIEACLRGQGPEMPLYLRGEGEEALDFLEWLFCFLPFQVRLGISFDTYGYSIRHDYEILVLPPGFQQPQAKKPAVEIDLVSGTATFNARIDPSPLARYCAALACAVQAEEADLFFSVMLSLERGLAAGLEERFNELPQAARDILAKTHARDLLRMLSQGAMWSALPLLVGQLTLTDLDALMSVSGFAEYLLSLRDSRAEALMAAWLNRSAVPEDLLGYALATPSIWEAFLTTWAASQPPKTHLIVQTLRFLARNYQETFEDILYAKILPLLGSIRWQPQQAQELAGAILSLPSPPASAQRGYLPYLRQAVAFELTGNESLYENLMRLQIPLMPHPYRRFVLTTLMEGAFALLGDEEMQHYLEYLLRYGGPILFTECLTECEVPKKQEIYRKELISHMLRVLPPQESERLKSHRPATSERSIGHAGAAPENIGGGWGWFRRLRKGDGR